MTSVALLDALADTELGPAISATECLSQRAALAHDLVVSTLEDLERVRSYEQMILRAAGSAPLRPAMRESAWKLYAEWAQEAVQVVDRVKPLARQGIAVPELAQLDDSLAGVRARLSISAAQVEASVEQARRGQSISVKDLRDELHTRVRA